MDGTTLATLDMDALLCYVEGEPTGYTYLCYFTTKPLAEQMGDDWNDAPHWCNAGRPYADEPHIIYALAVAGARFPDGYWSVDDCNEGRAPWLVDGHSWDDATERRIYGGITLRDFVTKCQEYGWTVYWPVAAAEEAA